jgi:hypothetical protein
MRSLLLPAFPRTHHSPREIMRESAKVSNNIGALL